MTRPLIYTVGDSHAWHAWLNIPGVKTNTVGPMLMHTFGKQNADVVRNFPKDVIVCFCWGEIDCRCHVHKHQPWTETVDRLAKAYLDTIRQTAQGFKDVWIFNIVPPPRKGTIVESEGFPLVGTDEERLAYARRLNDRLRESEFPFIDVYDQYADKDGFMRMEMSDGNVHVKDTAPIVDWIERRFAHAPA